MNFMNDNANMKQLQLIKFINEKCDDDHVISKISIVLRRDKIEAPYYMVTKIRLSTCIDRPENELIHAMDIINHARRYNLTENKYNEIKSMIIDSFDNDESKQVKIIKRDDELKVDLMTINDEEFENLFKIHQELFDFIFFLLANHCIFP